jgi:hypothetical protein
MEYKLFDKADANTCIARIYCKDDFAAEKWGREWLSANAASDEYILEREGGGFSALLLRTVAGQWYVMRK